jgi:hypothetical protein
VARGRRRWMREQGMFDPAHNWDGICSSRLRYPLNQTELPQQAIGPAIQPVLAMCLSVSVLFGA